MVRTSFVALALLAAPAAWAQKAAVLPFDGPGGDLLRNQVSNALCAEVGCVAPARVMSNGDADWRKLKRERVSWIVRGNIKGKPKRRTLEVELATSADDTEVVGTFPVGASGELSVRALNGLVGNLKRRLQATAQAQPDPEAAPPPARTPPPEETHEDPAPPPRSEEPAYAPDMRNDDGSLSTDRPKRRRKRVKQPYVVFDVSLALMSRNFTYTNPVSTNLLAYSAAPVLGPTFHLEVYPFQLMTRGAGATLGLEGEYYLSVGFKSRLKGSDNTYATNHSRWGAGLKYSWKPVTGSAFALLPFLGLRSQSFTIGTDFEGNKLSGFPNVSYFSLRAGLGLDIPLGASDFSLFGHFAVHPTFSAGEVLTTAFFPKGSVFGLEAAGGFGFRLTGWLSARVAVDWGRYNLSFKTEPTDPYVAGGAADQYLGGTLGLRAQY